MAHSHGVQGISSIDQISYTSRLAPVNPGLKMGFSFFLIVFCIATRNVPVCCFVAVLSAVTVVVLGGTELHAYLSVLTVPVGFMVVGALAIAIDFSGIRKENVMLALRVMSTAFGAVSAMFMMTLTTPVSEITGTMEKMHIPQLIIELMNLIYRFIFVLATVQDQMRTSAESRLGYCDFKTGLRTFGRTVGNLLVVSLSSAGAYFDAMSARCYDGRLAFLTEDRPLKRSHVAFCLVASFLAIAIWLLTR